MKKGRFSAQAPVGVNLPADVLLVDAGRARGCWLVDAPAALNRYQATGPAADGGESDDDGALTAGVLTSQIARRE